MAGYIHWTVCRLVGLQVTDRYCGLIPDRVINVNGTTGIWDVPVITDRTVPANRPDAVLRDKTEKTCLLIDIALPDDSNVNTKVIEELSNYKVCRTFTLSTLRASPTTLSPFLTSSSAMAAPIPALAPVTTATRPDQRSIADCMRDCT